MEPITTLASRGIGAVLWTAKNYSDAEDINDEANEINEHAESLVKAAKSKGESARRAAQRQLKRLAEKRKAIMDHPLRRFAASFGKLKNFGFKDLQINHAAHSMKIAKPDFFELGKLSSWEKCGVGLALGFLGVSFAEKSKARENLNDACSNIALARRYAAKIRLHATVHKAIGERARLYIGLAACACELFYPQLERLEEIVGRKTDYSKMSTEEQSDVCKAVTTVQLIRLLVTTNIITSRGRVSAESAKVATHANERLLELMA